MNFLITTLAAAALALLGAAASAAVLPSSVCTAQALPALTFSVVTEEARTAFEAVRAADAADDGQLNAGNEVYLATLHDLPQISGGDLEQETMVVFTWFPMIYVNGTDDVPEIRIFLRPLTTDESFVDTVTGSDVRTELYGAQVFMPAQGLAMPPGDAAKRFVGHVCNIRARLAGATDA